VEDDTMNYATPLHATPVGRTSLPLRAVALARGAVRGLNRLAPAVDLAIRWIVAGVFFKSGLTKIASWDSTLALFENEYHVPLLPPEAAAFLGTGVELIFPVLLVAGLGARFAAAVLFAFNIVAVISYPDLGEVGLMNHQTWGLLLLVTLLHGPGALSLDHWIGKHFFFAREASSS
jgi:putative oxidoreductase